MLSVKSFKCLTFDEKTQIQQKLELTDFDQSFDTNIVIYDRQNEITSFAIMNTTLFGYNKLQFLFLPSKDIIDMIKLLVKLPIIIELNDSNKPYLQLLQEHDFIKYNDTNEVMDIFGFDRETEKEIMIYCKKYYKTRKQKK